MAMESFKIYMILKLNFGEFLSAIREPLSERRLKLVCKKYYDPSNLREVINNLKKKNYFLIFLITEFINN